MKNKKIIAILVAVSLLQLIFPVGWIAYEKSCLTNIIEKGERFTLEYSQLIDLNKNKMYLDTEDLYKVSYPWDDGMRRETISIFSIIGITKNERGEPEFFFIEDENENCTDYNWFRVWQAFEINLSDYEFVNDDFGMKELVEMSIYLSNDETNTVKSYEQFMEPADGYYEKIWHIPFDGKITLCVYKGYALISEFYIGDELVLKHK